jgi:hypothetical protein
MPRAFRGGHGESIPYQRRGNEWYTRNSKKKKFLAGPWAAAIEAKITFIFQLSGNY